MLIQCPNCRTTYKVSDEVFKGNAPAFRCSRCKHTFESEAGESLEERLDETNATQAPSAKPARDEELSLPFGPKPEFDPGKIEPKADPLASAEFESFEPKQEEPAQWAIDEPSGEEERAFVMAESARADEKTKMTDTPGDFPEDDPLFRKLEFADEGETSNNILTLSPYLDQRASILPFVTLFGLLVLGFSLMAVISYAHPEVPESVLKNIPLVGATVLRNNHLKDGILIKSLGTGSQSIQGNREVFLVSGVALNQNPVVVREIQLTGKTYNERGKEIERQMIWVGNTLSPKIIRGMTLEDIPQLQELKPLKSFEIPPGDSVPFTIVFLKSAKGAKEFTCEVTGATGQT